MEKEIVIYTDKKLIIFIIDLNEPLSFLDVSLHSFAHASWNLLPTWFGSKFWVKETAKNDGNMTAIFMPWHSIPPIRLLFQIPRANTINHLAWRIQGTKIHR